MFVQIMFSIALFIWFTLITIEWFYSFSKDNYENGDLIGYTLCWWMFLAVYAHIY